MKKIEVGQKWKSKAHTPTAEVLGVREDIGEVWYSSSASKYTHTLGVAAWRDAFELVEPFFEIGKVYRYVHSHSDSSLRYFPRAIHEFSGRRYALAERLSSDPDAVALVLLDETGFQNFEEAGDR